jgi:Bacterial regulatory helix-turn-helix protein, lysR family
MEVRDLQIFLSVAKPLNYTRAAEEVNLSQPTVSVRMHQLERDVGTKLFEQLGKKIALTEAGRADALNFRHTQIPPANASTIRNPYIGKICARRRTR